MTTEQANSSESGSLAVIGLTDSSKSGALTETGADSLVTETGKTDSSKTDSLRETGMKNISVTEPGQADNKKLGSLVETGQT